MRALRRTTPDAMSAVAHVTPARTVRALAPPRGASRRRAGVVVRAAAAKSKPSADGTAASTERKPKVAVVGAGWGGFGAAKALCEAGCDVTLLDGIPNPTGMTPSTTPTGKPFEYGTMLSIVWPSAGAAASAVFSSPASRRSSSPESVATTTRSSDIHAWQR